MPNVDDHGLEVLKKAARNLDPTPKKDYALQVIQVADESGAVASPDPEIINEEITNANEEIEITLPADYKSFILKSRRIAKLRLAYVSGGTDLEWVSIPRGGYWTEPKKLTTNKIYVQSNVANTTLEIVVYK
jgi:hypothetical protein